MKKYFISIILSLGVSIPTIAEDSDRGFDELKQSFAKNEALYTKLLDMATILEPRMFEPGAFITKADCKKLESDIAKNYVHNPFSTVFQGGQFTYNLCGDEDDRLNYHLFEKGRTSMGLDFTSVVQVLTVRQSTSILRNTLLDDQMKIVGMIDLEIDLSASEITRSTVMNLDVNNNLFICTQEAQLKDERTGIEGTHTVDQVLLANGLFYLPIMRERHKSNADVSQSTGMIGYYRAELKDWGKFEVLPTFGRGLYEYDNEYYATPLNHSAYVRLYENDQEVCAFGTVTRGQTHTSYPSNEKERTDCLLRMTRK